MKKIIIDRIIKEMKDVLDDTQINKLILVLNNTEMKEDDNVDNDRYLSSFLNSKQIEGCSCKTIKYYDVNLKKFLSCNNKNIGDISTDDVRKYLSEVENTTNSSKVTLDNIRRVISSFFSWLEIEGIIIKSPVRRIKKIKTGIMLKKPFTDEELILIKNNCDKIRDRCIVDFLATTGVRIGELVKIRIKDIDFELKECTVTGKGNKQRKVYFDSTTKINLTNYINGITDLDSFLFRCLNNNRKLNIRTIESILCKIGKKANVENVHPHRFRRTLATKAIDKGMPIEQVKVLLGHSQVETTLRYAIVNEKNVKIGYSKYLE